MQATRKLCVFPALIMDLTKAGAYLLGTPLVVATLLLAVALWGLTWKAWLGV